MVKQTHENIVKLAKAVLDRMDHKDVDEFIIERLMEQFYNMDLHEFNEEWKGHINE